MFDEPGSASQFAIKDHVGSLLIIAVNGFMPQFPTSFGLRDTIRGEIAVVDGPNLGNRYGDAMIFSSKMVPQLKASIGRIVLGRVELGQAKQGQNQPYVLAKPTHDDVEKANAWVQANGAIEAHPISPDQWRPEPQPVPQQHGQAAQQWSGGSQPQGQSYSQWNQQGQGQGQQQGQQAQPSFVGGAGNYPSGGTYTSPPPADDKPPF